MVDQEVVLEALIYFLPALACGAMMFFCMRGMSMGSKHGSEQDQQKSQAQEIAELREEIAVLRTEKVLGSEQPDQERLAR